MGQFEKYTVDDIREIVEYDRPDAMNRQAAAWSAMSALLAEHATGLRAKSVAVEHNWTGRTATGVREELDRAETVMREAADTAVNNAHGWAEIAAIADWARSEVLRIHTEWCAIKAMPPEAPDPRYVPDGIAVVVGEPRDPEAMREPFDRAARAVMDSAAELTGELCDRYLRVPVGYRPPSDALPPVGPGSGPAVPDKAGGDTADGDRFGEEGSAEDPMLQGSGALHTSMHGYGSAPGGSAPSPGAGGPVLASAPLRPVIADRFGGDAGNRGGGFSRVPKPYTGDATSHRGLNAKAGTEPVDSEVERLSRRAPKPDEDDPWQPSEPTTPTVITGSQAPDPPFHDPGTVIGGR